MTKVGTTENFNYTLFISIAKARTKQSKVESILTVFNSIVSGMGGHISI